MMAGCSVTVTVWLAGGAEGEFEIDGAMLADFDADTGFDLRGEAFFFGADFVDADGQGGGGVTAVGVGDEFAGGGGFRVFYEDGCVGEGAAGGVADDAGDGAADDLGGGDGGDEG